MTKYTVTYPATPGAARHTRHSKHRLLGSARKAADDAGRDRRDLTWQDIRIERVDGTLVEYAGPARLARGIRFTGGEEMSKPTDEREAQREVTS